MRTARTTLLLALVSAAPAALAFEGAMDVKLTHTQPKGDEGDGARPAESGTGKIYLAKQGVRMEWQMGQGERQMKMATLMLRSQPDRIYFVNDATKTYSEMDTSKHREKDDADDDKITVKKLGNEKVAGFDCAHGLITTDKGEQVEVWTSKDVGDLNEFMNSQSGGAAAREKSWKQKYEALKSAGLNGWPMRWVDRRGDRGSTSWEVTRVEKGTPPAALFDLAGYKKSEGFAGAVQLSPEQQKKMDEALKKLTPEQRQQLEKMMKSGGK